PPEALPPAPLSADQASAANEVLGAAIESADLESARRMWRDIVGLAEEAIGEGWRYDLGNASLMLNAGVGEAAAPDRWLRLLLRVPSITALADRLDRERIDFEQGDLASV